MRSLWSDGWKLAALGVMSSLALSGCKSDGGGDGTNAAETTGSPATTTGDGDASGDGDGDGDASETGTATESLPTATM